MKKQFLAAVFAVITMFVVNPVNNEAQAAPQSAFVKVAAAPVVPISGTNTVSSFTGNFTVDRFVARNGQLLAVGTLTGTLTNLLTGVTSAVTSAIQIPVLDASGTCEILTLDLGPLNLDLLGLQVDLSAVSLVITAQSGQGKLLGNLLCAVANLLNGGSPLTSLTNLLNRILGQL